MLTRAHATRRVCCLAIVVVVSMWARRGLATPRFESIDPSALVGNGGMDLPGGGVALGDLDGDGDDDLAVVHQGDRVRLRFVTSGRLETRGDDLHPANMSAYWNAMSVAPTDIDGDGRTDLLFGATGGAYLLMRRADGGFDDRTALAFDGLWRQVSSFALADVDGDGLLDVYIVTYMVGADWPHTHCDRDALFLQREDGWRSVSLPDATSGAGCGFGAVLFDRDGDGDLDPFVANDFAMFASPTHAWRNDGIDSYGEMQVRDDPRVTAHPVMTYAMGVAVGDVDGDGLLDLATTSIGRAPLFRASGAGMLDDVTEQFAVGGPLGRVGTRVTWGVVLGDLDGDGATDLFESGGHLALDPSLGSVAGGSTSFFFHGHAPPWIEEPFAPDAAHADADYRGLAIGDIDADGAPDLALAGGEGGNPVLLRNVTSPSGPWLEVIPHGTVSPREARGAIVTLSCTNGPRRISVVPTGGNAGSMSAPRAFVSSSNCTDPALRIDWPSGAHSALTVPTDAVNHVMIADEPAWLHVDRTALAVGETATMAITPGDAIGSASTNHTVALSLIAGHADLSSVTMDAAGAFHATVAARAAGEVWIAILVDGRIAPRHVRLPVSPGPRTTVTRVVPAAISASRAVDVAWLPRRADGSFYGPGMHIPVLVTGGTGASMADDRGGGLYVAHVSLDVGRVDPVHVTATLPSGEMSVVDVRVIDDIDPARTLLTIRPGYTIGANPPSIASVYATLFTPLGDPIATRHDGWIHLADSAGNLIGQVASGEPASSSFVFNAHDAASLPFRIVVGSTDASPPISMQSIATADDVIPHLSASASHLDAMQRTLQADGIDSTVLVLRLADAQGNLAPLPTIRWDITGGRLDRPAGADLDGSALWRVIAGTEPGVLTATAYAGAIDVSTTITLVPPSAVPAASLELCVSGVYVSSGALLAASVHPRGANGLLAGGQRTVTLKTDDVAMPVAWDHGSYVASWMDTNLRPTLTLHARDEGAVVPAFGESPIDVSLVVPLGALNSDAAMPAWSGELRCATATRSGVPSDGGVDASSGVVLPDASAPLLHAGGGCGCRTRHSTRDSSVVDWVVLAAAAVVVRRKRCRGAGMPRMC